MDAQGKGKMAATAKASEDLLPWCVLGTYGRVEKYRPSSLDEILAHQHITATRTLPG